MMKRKISSNIIMEYAKAIVMPMCRYSSDILDNNVASPILAHDMSIKLKILQMKRERKQ